MQTPGVATTVKPIRQLVEKAGLLERQVLALDPLHFTQLPFTNVYLKKQLVHTEGS